MRIYLIPHGGALFVDDELRGAHPFGDVAFAVDALDGVDGLVGQLERGGNGVRVRDDRNGGRREIEMEREREGESRGKRGRRVMK